MVAEAIDALSDNIAPRRATALTSREFVMTVGTYRVFYGVAADSVTVARIKRAPLVLRLARLLRF
jgi:hypothetical protein